MNFNDCLMLNQFCIPEIKTIWSRLIILFVVLQSFSRIQLFATPWTAARQSFLSFTISWSLLKLKSTESVMPSNHLVLCRPLVLLPSMFPSITVFPNESVLRIRWPKDWSFSLSISPSSEYSGLTGLISLQSKGLSSLHQHYSSKASVFLVLSFLHSPTLTSIHDHWKNHRLD